MSKDKSSISAYGVGDGKLYIGAGRLTEEELRREEYLAGESEGGCRLTYTAKSFPIRDINGSVVTVLRYGEKTVVSGRLRRIDVSVLSALTGCGCEKENGRETLCLGTGSDRRREVSALLVCPLPDGEELVIIARGTAVSGIDMRLDTDRDSAVGFELVSCGDGSYLTIK
jgi:hypothetical protein